MNQKLFVAVLNTKDEHHVGVGEKKTKAQNRWEKEEDLGQLEASQGRASHYTSITNYYAGSHVVIGRALDMLPAGVDP